MPIGDKIHNIEINDSEFEREGWKNSRYKGTKLTGAKINEFNRGDITYGLNPVIEQYSRAVYVFNYVQDSFEALSGQFYPTTDEFSQTLPDKTIIGCAKFKIDRAIVFEIGNTNNHTQISPGVDNKDPNYYYFDTLMKTDLSIHSSCSVRLFGIIIPPFPTPAGISLVVLKSKWIVSFVVTSLNKTYSCFGPL